MVAEVPDRTRQDGAAALLDAFLEDTGVVGPGPPRRYLWTDAFAVCTLLELDRRGLQPGLPGERLGYRELARVLEGQVHEVLGGHRPDDPRRGPLSGLSAEEAARHPTAGGLRIGKPLPERPAGVPADPREEWDRDGQYFHYLTRWMHALLRMAEADGDPEPLRWALELARAAWLGFRRPDGHLAWKMSVDLSRPLVEGAGRHDPLDGYITLRTLLAAADRLPGATSATLTRELDAAAREMAAMAGIREGRGWATEDPLGLGGLLTDAWRVLQLDTAGADPTAPGLLRHLLDAAWVGLDALARSRLLEQPPARRLPFREIGLAIGLHAVERMKAAVDSTGAPRVTPEVRSRIDQLADTAPLAWRVEELWLDPDLQRVPTWTDHADINGVMLATSLVPDGYLSTSGVRGTD